MPGQITKTNTNPILKFSSEPFDTIVSVSKVRYFWSKVSYRYRISIEIYNLESINSVSVSKFQSKKYQFGITFFTSSIKVSISPFKMTEWTFKSQAK